MSQPTVTVEPSENVYSFFLFAVPKEDQRRPGQFSCNKFLAYVLVFSSALLQAVLLYAIFNSIVANDIEWRNSILDPRGERFVGSEWMPHDDSVGKCNTGGSLCIKRNGTYSCAPPTIQLTGRWNELDTDGDGIWTREEVEAEREALQCKYAVNPVEVFDVFVKFLLSREGIIWIHPDLRAGRAIHKAYFTYAAGDIIMCGYRTVDSCANLLKRGFFDGPLKYGTAPRVGTTIDSALDYCHNLLDEGGVCERTLPSTYSVWKKSSDKQCLTPKYSKYVYAHPVTGRTKSMLTVNYGAVKDYHRAGASSMFLIYKTVIVSIFLLAMLGELKEVWLLAQWVIGFTSEDPADSSRQVKKQEEGEEEEEDNVIRRVSVQFRAVMAFLVLARFAMLVVLTWVGSLFLLKDTDYINLLLNSLALIVVIEIIQNLYIFLISPELRQDCESIEPMTVPAIGIPFLNRNPAMKDVLVIVLFFVAVVGLMYTNHVVIVDPLSKALECACLSEGDQCFEKRRFSYDFWKEYWTEDVPKVLGKLDSMKEEVERSEKSSMLSVASYVDTHIDDMSSGLLLARNSKRQSNRRHKAISE